MDSFEREIQVHELNEVQDTLQTLLKMPVSQFVETQRRWLKKSETTGLHQEAMDVVQPEQ